MHLTAGADGDADRDRDGDGDAGARTDADDEDVEAGLQHDHRSLHEQQEQPLQPQTGRGEHKLKQKKFAHQRSILKNSLEHNNEDVELLEAKKQLILRRRRLFSHYRQYEQWRRRQFSYDSCFYRAAPLPIGQAACGEHASFSGVGAFRRRRQYRRQYSCAERSREDSRDSRESSSLHKYKCRSVAASDTINTDSSTFNHGSAKNSNAHRSPAERPSHFHMLQEEHSASISERCTRSRINSAIFVSSEGRGFDSIEFLRRHGSQSVLCRKARSAENITDNERKKSFSDNKRQWRIDDAAESNAQHFESTNGSANDAMAIELQERTGVGVGIGAETRTLAVLKSSVGDQQNGAACALTTVASMVGHSAAVTTSTTNVVVGSISIEAPPAYMKDDINAAVEPHAQPKQHRQTARSGMASTNSASHDSSTDTVEELILVPAAAAAKAVESSKPRMLVRQRSSTASSSPHNSPKALSLRGVKPKVAAALPMVSVSGPSPPHEKPTPPPPAECL